MSLIRRWLLGVGQGGSAVINARQLLNPSSVGWTVPQDPKAVHGGGKTFFGWTGSDGDDYIASIDDGTGHVSTPFALHGGPLTGSQGAPDPHASPAILIRNDGHLVVAYCAHEGSTAYLRISTNAYDATAFGTEVSLDSQLGGTSYTYMGLAQLSAETNTIHIFFRNRVSGTGYIAWAKSTDNGATWGTITDIFDPNTGQRAYRRMGSNGTNRIDIITTHKDPDPNPATAAAIYHMYYSSTDGLWHASDGTNLTLPATKLTATLVLGVTTGSNWSGGITYSGGNPVSLTFIQHSTTVDVHQARWSGSAWSDLTLVDGLAAFDSNAYLPGAMDMTDVNRVLVSVQSGSHWEMQRYDSSDSGATWTPTVLTSGSTQDHTQPDPVWNPDPSLRYVWLYGFGGTAPDYNDGNFAIWGGF